MWVMSVNWRWRFEGEKAAWIKEEEESGPVMWKCGKTEGRLQPADVTLPNCFHTEGWASGAKQPLMPGARQPESEGRHTLAFLCSVGIFCPLKLKTRSRRKQVAAAVQVTSFTDKYVSWGHFKTGANRGGVSWQDYLPWSHGGWAAVRFTFIIPAPWWSRCSEFPKGS